MISKIEIFNMALGFIGTRTLVSERESAPEAAACRLYFDRARRSALRDYPYSFAVQKIRLQRVEKPEGWDWLYAYDYPPEALKIVRIGDNAAFETGLGIGGRHTVFANEADAYAHCVVDAPDISLWDELFIMAIAYRLAMLIAAPLLKNNPQKIQELANLYQACLPRLEGHDASARRKAPEASENWLLARRV